MSKMRFFALQELSNRKPLEITTPSNKPVSYTHLTLPTIA